MKRQKKNDENEKLRRHFKHKHQRAGRHMHAPTTLTYARAHAHEQ